MTEEVRERAIVVLLHLAENALDEGVRLKAAEVLVYLPREDDA